jgi:hypothetical protein
MPDRSAALLVAALAAGACAPKLVPHDPFKVPRERFYGSLKAVALAPMRAPSDLEDAETVKARFTATVEARLRGAGLKIVPPAEVGPVLDAAVAAQGGIYDPFTGKLDQVKASAAKRTAVAQLRERYGADALLRVDLRVVSARLDHDVASWDGVTESAGIGFWKASGRLPALSIVAWLTGADGTDLYSNAGGLRIIQRLDAHRQMVKVPQAELFADEARNARAVSLALDPLLGTPAQPPTPSAEAKPGG